MKQTNFYREILHKIFSKKILINENLIFTRIENEGINNDQTQNVFSEKWSKYQISSEKEKLFEFQKKWFLKLYGFKSEIDLENFLIKKKVVFDAGCGLGYKAAWFASLAPETLVLAMDFSDSVIEAAKTYKKLKNLFFIKGDISDTPFLSNAIDFINCDQVIMHTEDPKKTFSELSRICSNTNGEFTCYFYTKKALPRELLDDHFRLKCKSMSHKELWEMSKQLTILGKNLSELNIKINVPEIKALDIKGGEYDIQRFIYWNFLKCFWNENLGYDTSLVTNFDWYSPSNAKRYSKEEIDKLILYNNLSVIYFHEEEACYSGRFGNKNINK